MKITDLPMNGKYKRNEWDHFEWERLEGYPNTLRFRKIAECENPDYEGDITFPNGVINFDDMSACDISIPVAKQYAENCVSTVSNRDDGNPTP